MHTDSVWPGKVSMGARFQWTDKLHDDPVLTSLFCLEQRCIRS